MKLEQLKATKGSRKKRTRKGIGDSSAGRGEKGYSKREGNSRKLGFEGGQTPLYRRIPKRGFTNNLKVTYDVMNIAKLETLEIETITPQILIEMGIYKPKNKKLKILGNTKINKKLKISADAFSKSAEKHIKDAGGEAILIKKIKS